jgi:hypothetical protein
MIATAHRCKDDYKAIVKMQVCIMRKRCAETRLSHPETYVNENFFLTLKDVLS